jgi:hypothetical protein
MKRFWFSLDDERRVIYGGAIAETAEEALKKVKAAVDDSSSGQEDVNDVLFSFEYVGLEGQNWQPTGRVDEGNDKENQ